MENKENMMKGNHYVSNEEFLNALIDYRKKVKEAQAANKSKPIISNYIGECFLKIAEHLSRKPNFISYSFRDEMISDGVENCIQYIDNFDPEKSKNPFAYFTQIIYYAFIRRIQKEKKQLYVKYKATEQFGILDDDEIMELEDSKMLTQFELHDNILRFIQTFEDTKKKKKEKVKGIEKFLSE